MYSPAFEYEPTFEDMLEFSKQLVRIEKEMVKYGLIQEEKDKNVIQIFKVFAMRFGIPPVISFRIFVNPYEEERGESEETA